MFTCSLNNDITISEQTYNAKKIYIICIIILTGYMLRKMFAFRVTIISQRTTASGQGHVLPSSASRMEKCRIVFAAGNLWRGGFLRMLGCKPEYVSASFFFLKSIN